MIECEWCRAPCPEGARVCDNCAGALPPRVPAHRPALLSRRDREHLGTVLGPLASAPAGGGTLLHGSLPLGGHRHAAPTEVSRTGLRPSRAASTNRLAVTQAAPSDPSSSLNRPPTRQAPSRPNMGHPIEVAALDQSVLGAYSLQTRATKPTEPPAMTRLARLLPAGLRRRAAQAPPLTLKIIALVAAAAFVGALLAVLLPQPHLELEHFRVTGEGHDQVGLLCEDCAPGSHLRWGVQTVRLTGGSATFEAQSALPVGENFLNFELLEPKKKPVPLPLRLLIAFRVTIAQSGISSWPPTASVIVDAPAGADVEISGQKARNQGGSARHLVDLSAQARGATPSGSTVRLDLPVRVVIGKKEHRSTARIRANRVPLTYSVTSAGESAHRMSPGPNASRLQGRTLPGATLTLSRRDAQAGSLQVTTADASGQFSLPLPAARTEMLRLQASAPGHLLSWDLVQP